VQQIDFSLLGVSHLSKLHCKKQMETFPLQLAATQLHPAQRERLTIFSGKCFPNAEDNIIV